MNGLEQYREIKISELDPSNIFFSVVTKCREKGIFDKQELIYIDVCLNSMLEETAKNCGKGYIKPEIAKIMLRNVFMILDSAYTVSDFHGIINAVKEKKLDELWKRGIRESSAYLERARMNFFNLEHLSRMLPELHMDFAVRLKNDLSFSNVFTHSYERASFTAEFFGFGEQTDYRTLAKKSEILCTECGLIPCRSYEDIYPLLEARNAIKEKEKYIKYTSQLFDTLIFSVCYSAYYRVDGVFPYGETAKEVFSELSQEEPEVLKESILSYLQMAVKRGGIRIAEKEESVGESILNVYASRVNNENLMLLAEHLASEAVKGRGDFNKMKNLVYFL